MVLVVPLSQVLIDAYGWRTAFRVLGGAEHRLDRAGVALACWEGRKVGVKFGAEPRKPTPGKFALTPAR